MTETAKRAEIRRKSPTSSGFDLLIDGIVFPWHIARDDAEVIDLAPGDKRPLMVLRIGIIIEGPVIGADEFNEYLADEADAFRVRRADHRDSLAEQVA